ncbi:hypothetical protein [Methylobacterium brachythecii]|uniref:Uncharacterized protein n=1 Tax=Methylobacterium brachythecii TaxID=1176177 RepID=A0A7W6F742_9HYPH|nr:hypothetical protein [Methylobacterium brachythecii]MBB3903097.1 hypothetical protein [Methylobacterium brachythecii]GLS44677.1 hypothetical protein GCM10007884_26650 [Methylobacterium brachythecii]
MKLLTLAASAAVLFGLASQSARAETPEEIAFGFGQFTGAATFCKLPKDKVQAVAAGLLGTAGIDMSGPGPEMTKFKEGVTDGVRSMQAPDASSCEDVTTAFNQAYEKLQ